MRVGFFGTPDLAAYILQELVSKFEVVFLVAPEDKEYGRNRRLRICPTKEFAQCNDIPVLQPVKLNEESFLDELRSFNADIFVVVAYGKIIPRSVFDMPRLGTINFHPSLLPKYRGAAPVQWSIINGDPFTGVTVQRINERLDAGDIILQKRVDVDENITSAELFSRVLPVGADLVSMAIEGLDDKTIEPEVQNEEDATYCGKIDRETAHIDWNLKNYEIHNLVRGLNPKPVAWTTFRDTNMKIWATKIPDDAVEVELGAGEILKYQKKRLLAGTGSGLIEILKLQPENKKDMDSLAFLNGSRLEPGEFFI